MTLSSVGSSLASSMQSAQGPTAGAVMGKVLDQEKADGKATVQLIDSAAPEQAAGHTLSVYA